MSSNASWQVVPDKDGNYAENPKFELSKDARLYAKSLKKNERWTIWSRAILLVVCTKGKVVYTENSADKDTIYNDDQYVAFDEKYALQVQLSKSFAQLVCIEDEGCSFVVFLVKSDLPEPESRLSFRSLVSQKFDNPVVGKDFAYTFDGEGNAKQIENKTLVTLAAPSKLERFIHVRVDTNAIPPFSFRENGSGYGGSPPGRISIARITDTREDYRVFSALSLYVVLPPRTEALATKNWQEKLDQIREPHFVLFQNKSTEITLNSLKDGASIDTEVHADKDQIVMVVKGVLTVKTENENAVVYDAGQVFVVKAGKKHSIHNYTVLGSEAKFISTYAKTSL